MFPASNVLSIEVPGATLLTRVIGTGEPAILLHGYPQTHAMWGRLARLVGPDRQLILPDLRGYGRSRTSDGDLSFGTMAADILAVASELGLSRFHLVGHDRGGRVAHRLALDAPERVMSITLLDIIPTADVWEHMADRELALRYFHWAFLAQPGGLPQRLIGADPDDFLRTTLVALGGSDDIFEPEALAEYREAAKQPSLIDSWCADYAAASSTDLVDDEADEGRTLGIPALILWGTAGAISRFDPLAAWRRWYPAAVGHGVGAGHFLAEERPEAVWPLIACHWGRAVGRAVTE